MAYPPNFHLSFEQGRRTLSGYKIPLWKGIHYLYAPAELPEHSLDDVREKVRGQDKVRRQVLTFDIERNP